MKGKMNSRLEKVAERFNGQMNVVMEDSLVLFGKEVTISMQKSLNQKDLFSDSHVKFDCVMKTGDGEPFSFTYQCNPKFHDFDVKDIFGCILTDASCYESSRDIDDFASEFGYEKVSKAIEAYNACERACGYLKETFSEKELELLYDDIENGLKEGLGESNDEKELDLEM